MRGTGVFQFLVFGVDGAGNPFCRFDGEGPEAPVAADVRLMAERRKNRDEANARLEAARREIENNKRR